MVLFETVDQAVKDGKRPAEAGEKKLRDTTRLVFQHALKAAEQQERPLPVEFDKLTKFGVTAKYKGKSLDGDYVIAKDAQMTSAKNSVIFATGEVRMNSAKNCVIVAHTIHCNNIDNCLIFADDFLRLNTAHSADDKNRSVLIAGQWIRASTLDGPICHVIRPGVHTSPGEGAGGGGRQAAIGTNRANNVIYLNLRIDTRGSDADRQTYLPLAAALVK